MNWLDHSIGISADIHVTLDGEALQRWWRRQVGPINWSGEWTHGWGFQWQWKSWDPYGPTWFRPLTLNPVPTSVFPDDAFDYITEALDDPDHPTDLPLDDIEAAADRAQERRRGR